ncbi:MAG TPA: SurA N-terminal domain-containing protein [Cyclobacteriaceae bacterium]|nr:SurA N-terminal domain-containing protein [Cyclobacteriaceae bacterium]
MALIGKLREKMGVGVVIFVFVAISAFILGDLLGNNSVLLGDNSVGEIAGRSISLEEFQAAVQERESSYVLNFNRQPGDREMPGIRQQAWEMLILRYAIQKQIQETGTQVTVDEVEDMIHGKNVNESLKQAFTNQQTGQFDPQQVVGYMQQLNSMPETSEPRIRWEIFQRDLEPGRARIKYENLMIKSAYVTTAEAEREYHTQTDVAEVKYVFVPYFAISDSAVSPTDSDFKAYYNKNKERYKSEHTRDLKFVQFPVVASADDSLAIKVEIAKLASEFKNATDDSAFAVLNSDNANAFAKYHVGNVPSFIDKSELVEGTVKGPFIDGSTYKLVKVSKVGKDTAAYARASHILIRWADETDAAKQEAKEKARKILSELKGGASFAAKALEHGTDGTAQNGGDLGWFPRGEMVKPFADAVFNASKTGLLNDVVETSFGYHIISITNTKDYTSYSIAVIEREITPSDASINEALRKAETFAVELSGADAFTAKAEKEGITVFDAKNVGTADRRVNTLSDARQIVQWLFRDASVGKVSSVFDLQDLYVVAVMTGEVEKGYKPLELVKEEITPAVKNQLKGKIIIEKLNGLQGSLEEIASAFGKDATVQSMNDLKLSSPMMTSVGVDALAVGTSFSPESGKRTKAFAGERGVVLTEMQNKTIAPALPDYSTYKETLEQMAKGRNTNSIAEAIKLNANIVDNRYKFY